MNNPPLISVMIPCYNQAHYLAQALDSVLAQTYPHFEIIVINDGSPDNIQEVMQPYLADPRVYLHNQPNRGLGRTRNVALKLAHGDYFQFLDADDWLAPEKFESQLEIMEKDKSIGFAYCDFYYYWQDTGKLEPMSSHLAGSLEEDPLPVYWSRWLFPPNAILMRREWVEKVGEFRTDLKWAEDVEYWLRAMAEGCKVRHVPRYLAYYRRHPLSKTALYVASGEAASEVRYHFLKKYPLEAARASYIAFERLRDEIDERDWALYKSGVELNEAKEQIALKEAALINLHEAHREHITQAAYHYKQLEAHYRQLEAKFRDVEKYARSLQDEVAKRANPGPE